MSARLSGMIFVQNFLGCNNGLSGTVTWRDPLHVSNENVRLTSNAGIITRVIIREIFPPDEQPHWAKGCSNCGEYY